MPVEVQSTESTTAGEGWSMTEVHTEGASTQVRSGGTTTETTANPELAVTKSVSNPEIVSRVGTKVHKGLNFEFTLKFRTKS